MKIGIIGTGDMARVLGKQWAKHGHELLFGSRDVDKAQAIAAEISSEAKSGTFKDAATWGEVVLIAVHNAAVMDVLQSVGASEGALADKVVIDCNNPVAHDTLFLTVGFTTSLAEQIAATALGAHVVKAFNMAQAQVWDLEPPQFDNRQMTVFYCGDNEQAKATVAELIKDVGCEPIDVGVLKQARLLEPAANLVIYLIMNGYGPMIALNLDRK